MTSHNTSTPPTSYPTHHGSPHDPLFTFSSAHSQNFQSSSLIGTWSTRFPAYFADRASGLHAERHVHTAAPAATVVDVDNDPVTVREGQALLAGTPNASYMEGDVRDIQA